MDTTTIPTIRLHNGVEMPQLGLGVWKMTDDEVLAAVRTAISAGYRMVDTAKAYGNEQAVGRAIRESGVPREQLFVTSKLWNDCHDYDVALREFDASLERLGLDYLDLYLIHWPIPMDGKFVQAWHALEKLYADKRVRAIGVSNFLPQHLQTLLANSTTIPMVNQIELHPKFQQKDVQAFCNSHNIVIEAYSPLMHGGEVLEDPLVAELAQHYGRSPAQIILRWHMQHGWIAIPKATEPKRVQDNSHIFDFSLSDEDMAHIDAMDAGTRISRDPNTANFV